MIYLWDVELDAHEQVRIIGDPSIWNFRTFTKLDVPKFQTPLDSIVRNGGDSDFDFLVADGPVRYLCVVVMVICYLHKHQMLTRAELVFKILWNQDKNC